MPLTKEKTTLTWLWVIKLFEIIPVAITAFAAKKLYDLVAKNPELQSPLYGRHILVAQQLVYYGCVILFPWLFISCALMFKFRGSWLLLYGMIDLSLTMVIIVGLAFQDRYLPASTKACRKAEEWKVNGDHMSFFSQAAAHNTKDTAAGKCKSFVSTWELGLCVAFFHMIVSYVGIFFDEREFSILNPFRPLFYLILAVIGPFYYFYINIVPRIRFAFFYLVKLPSGLRGLKTLRFEKPTPYVPRYDSMTISNPKLQQILTIEHVLLNVVDYLHYDDIINLSLTSKSVREAVYPGRDLQHRLPKLLKRSCNQGSTRKACLYCNKKICEDCKVSVFQPVIPGRRHISSCIAYCSKCYYQEFSRRQPGYKRPCSCRYLDATFEYQDVCHSCSTRDLTELGKIRQKRFRQEAKDIAQGKCFPNNTIDLPPENKPKCSKCHAEFPSGTRWWKCTMCEGECRDRIHPPFVGKAREPDLEMAESMPKEKDEAGIAKWLSFFRNR
ncbi:hypothetical protein BCR34DRAFT_602525 [Clohesyomyces aquaticus]|uniref:F-box domain-containing protein n=1 Tax=Clohesyomyces aquaticus TaxID=1231657 RepID=A0A1Y1ZJC9_9PLEO|nr:hypothetical protein BCR34DRAFT_602525 [Clohesyomyces aquaticus]